MEQSNGCGSDFRQRMLSIDSRFRSVNMEHDMMTGVFRQVERERERGGGGTFEFRIETGVSVLARVIVPRTVCLFYNECMVRGG